MIIVERFEGAHPARSSAPNQDRHFMIAITILPASQRRSASLPAARRSRPALSLTTSADLLQALRSRQALVCPRSNKLVVFAPTDKTGRLRPPQPHLRSVRDLQIPIGPAQPNRPPPPRGFLLTRVSNAGPASSPPRLQRAGVRNPSAKRSLRIATVDVAVGGKPVARNDREHQLRPMLTACDIVVAIWGRSSCDSWAGCATLDSSVRSD